jgi:hypothetical protein
MKNKQTLSLSLSLSHTHTNLLVYKFVKLAAEVFPPVQMLLGPTHCCHIALRRKEFTV